MGYSTEVSLHACRQVGHWGKEQKQQDYAQRLRAGNPCRAQGTEPKVRQGGKNGCVMYVLGRGAEGQKAAWTTTTRA